VEQVSTDAPSILETQTTIPIPQMGQKRLLHNFTCRVMQHHFCCQHQEIAAAKNKTDDAKISFIGDVKFHRKLSSLK